MSLRFAVCALLFVLTASVSEARFLGKLEAGGAEGNMSADEVHKFANETYLYLNPNVYFDGQWRSIFATSTRKISCVEYYKDIFVSIRGTEDYCESIGNDSVLITVAMADSDGVCRAFGHDRALNSFSKKNWGLRDLILLSESGAVRQQIDWYTGPGGDTYSIYSTVTCYGEPNLRIRNENEYR